MRVSVGQADKRAAAKMETAKRKIAPPVKNRRVTPQGVPSHDDSLAAADDLLVRPDPADTRLTRRVAGVDERGRPLETSVTIERPLTLYLNGQEIVTMMTIGDYPEYLALGYLLNQNMLLPEDKVRAVDFDEDIGTIVVRTERRTNYEEKLKKKTQTSGCAQGTVFGDVMEKFEKTTLAKDAVFRTSWLYDLLKTINTTPSLYLEAGAIHGCALARENRVLLYMEDVGRHNAVDKIAGYMYRHGLSGGDKIFYTTGRLTSEMVIKTVQMGIPILISRSGFTAWGVDLARQVGLTLIGRSRGKRFIALAGEDRIVFDADADRAEDEPAGLNRKAGRP
jgi:FdhD protein